MCGGLPFLVKGMAILEKLRAWIGNFQMVNQSARLRGGLRVNYNCANV